MEKGMRGVEGGIKGIFSRFTVGKPEAQDFGVKKLALDQKYFKPERLQQVAESDSALKEAADQSAQPSLLFIERTRGEILSDSIRINRIPETPRANYVTSAQKVRFISNRIIDTAKLRGVSLDRDDVEKYIIEHAQQFMDMEDEMFVQMSIPALRSKHSS